MLSPSSEQLAVINAIKEGYNVQVDAVAGSGKTTTVLCLADMNSDKIIMQLTYNTELKEEVNHKKRRYSDTMCLDNLSINTYHSLAYKFYTTEAKTDLGISKAITEEMQPIKHLPNIDVLVLDEVQDMNELYFSFVVKFIRDLKRPIQILVLGDQYQGLYEFKGADTRYLTFANRIWRSNLSPFEFKVLQLTTSYRVTNQIATFVNDIMLGYQRMKAVKDGPNIEYIRHTNNYANYKLIGRKLIDMIHSGYAKPEDIFILGGSVKAKNSPIKFLENMLVSNHIPCYVPMDETSSISSDIIKHKVIFSSIHQSKGRERKVVVVFGFDKEYFTYYNRNANIYECPSTLYVAVTRATDTLILLETNEPLPFLRKSQAEISREPYITFNGVPLGLYSAPSTNKSISMNSNEPQIFKLTPTNMIKFLQEDVMVEVATLMREHIYEIDENSYPENVVKIPSTITSIYSNTEITEEVYDINGLVIPALFEEKYGVARTNTLKTYVSLFLKRNPNSHFYVNKAKNLDFENTSLSDQLRIANLYISLRENVNFKVAQIRDYNWLDQSMVTNLFTNMERHIEDPSKLKYEESLVEYTDDVYENLDTFVSSNIDKNYKFRFSARVDAIEDDIVWEFKCTDEIQVEHQLQLVIYAWLWHYIHESSKGVKQFRLMNIKTGEVQNLVYKSEIIDSIITCILKSKYSEKEEVGDEAFIEKCLLITE